MFSEVRVALEEEGNAYYSVPALSNSLLKSVDFPELFCALWDCLLTGAPDPRERTDSMLAGQMLEDLLTGGKTVWEPRNRRKLEDKPEGVEWLPESKYDETKAIAEELLKLPEIRYLNGAGVYRQVELYATHTATGLPFKGRLDALCLDGDIPYIADLKRPGELKNDRGMGYWMADFGVPTQGAAYLGLCHAAFEEFALPASPTQFLIVAALPKWPYAAQVYVALSTERENDVAYANYLAGVEALERKMEMAAEMIRTGVPRRAPRAIHIPIA
jgi:hypothetical protein